MTLTDLNHCFSGSLTITVFVLLSLVILEHLFILDTYVSEIVNTILKKFTQEMLMNYITRTDI